MHVHVDKPRHEKFAAPVDLHSIRRNGNSAILGNCGYTAVFDQHRARAEATRALDVDYRHMNDGQRRPRSFRCNGLGDARHPGRSAAGGDDEKQWSQRSTYLAKHDGSPSACSGATVSILVAIGGKTQRGNPSSGSPAPKIGPSKMKTGHKGPLYFGRGGGI